MAQDATGTPTAKGIPKFNTAVDPPSGKGGNAQMDAIDTLLDSYVAKPSGIATGEVPVWNGSAFVRSSVTRIGTVRPQDLTQDGAATSQVLAWNGSIWAPAAGGGITVIDRVSTNAVFASSVAENSIYSKSIAGNTIGATGFLRLTLVGLISTLAGTDTERIKVKFGATTVLDTGATTIDNSAASTNTVWKAEILVQNDNATNAQTTSLLLYFFGSGGSGTAYTTGTGRSYNAGRGTSGYNTSALDTTSAQTLDVTWQHGTNNAACSVTMLGAVLELM